MLKVEPVGLLEMCAKLFDSKRLLCLQTFEGRLPAVVVNLAHAVRNSEQCLFEQGCFVCSLKFWLCFGTAFRDLVLVELPDGLVLLLQELLTPEGRLFLLFALFTPLSFLNPGFA